MVKDFKYSDAARSAVAEGIQEVYRLLLATYGPAGGNAVMDDENNNLLLSSQTYSILRNLKSNDLFVDTGIQLAREAALNTERLAGDGSVITLLFMNEMICQAKRLIAAGINPVMLGKGLKKALPVVEEKIRETAEAYNREKLLQMLQYELTDEKLAEIVYKSYEKVGKNGTVIVKEGHGFYTEFEYLEGFEMAGGYLSESLCMNLKDKVNTLYNPYVLIVDGEIHEFAQLLPVLEQIVDAGASLVIAAEDIKGEALTLMVSNIRKKVFHAAVVKAAGIGRRKKDLLKDLAVVTGGCVLGGDSPLSLSTVTLSDLGRAAEVRIEKNRTIFFSGYGKKEEVVKQITRIKEYINAKDTDFMNKNQYYERIGNLEGKIAVIRVGGASLLQMHEETHKIQSALAFIRAVTDKGVLSGGGSALAFISAVLRTELQDGREEEKQGELLLLDAIMAPAKAFVLKEGLGEKESLKIMIESGGRIGYNVVKHKFSDMKEDGIFDAAAVVLTAMDQAVSVVYEWLQSEVLMVSVRPDQEDIALMKQGVPIMRG